MILRLIWIRSPLSAISAAAAFKGTASDQIWFYYITILTNCTTDFIASQIFLITPFIVHVHNVSLHLGKVLLCTDP